MTEPRDANQEDRGEGVEELDALEDRVAEAAQAAATAAAHAVAAAKAAEQISKAREDAESEAAQSDTNAESKDLARVAASEDEVSSESTDPHAQLPDDSATKPDLVASAADAEPKQGTPTEESPANSADEGFDLLNLDAPGVAAPTVITRLAFMALGAAAAIFVVSFVLVSTVPKGTVFDVIILVAWLGVGALAVGGFVLLAAAGFAKLTRSADRA